MEYVDEFNEPMLQISDLGENEAFFSFMHELKPRVKQKLQYRELQ